MTHRIGKDRIDRLIQRKSRDIRLYERKLRKRLSGKAKQRARHVNAAGLISFLLQPGCQSPLPQPRFNAELSAGASISSVTSLPY